MLTMSMDDITRIQDDIQRMRLDATLDNPEAAALIEQIDGLSPDETRDLFTQMWKQNYPGAMLCGAAHFASEVLRMAEMTSNAGAGNEAFILGVNELVKGAIHAHVGHHDGQDQDS